MSERHDAIQKTINAIEKTNKSLLVQVKENTAKIRKLKREQRELLQPVLPIS